MGTNFRTLYPHEIECKATVSGPKIEITLHCKAATCTKLLNETVGAMNWEKEYTNGNKNCIVRIWDKDKNRMISKEDCGGGLTDVDGYKGQASNGFKRVCALGWGLGIELYSQPTILLAKREENIAYNERKEQLVLERYSVKTIEYNEDTRTITRVIIEDSNGNVVYDGPDENGGSRVTYTPVNTDTVIIPADADIIAEQEQCQDNDEAQLELPDNTDGFEDVQDEPEVTDSGFEDAAMNGFSAEDFEKEITRVHVRASDVLKKLGISSFAEIQTVDKELAEDVLNRLKGMATYKN